MGRRVATIVLAVLLTGAWLLQQTPAGQIPELPAPPAVPARALRPVKGAVKVVLRDVRFTTSLQARVELPLLEITPRLPDLASQISEIHIEALRLVGMRVISPIDTIHVSIELFTVIPGPRLRVDRVSIVDAEIGELADPRRGYGRWFFHLRDFDLELRDIDVAGKRSTPERLRLARLDYTGEAKGIPMQITRAEATVARMPAYFDLRLGAGLGLTRLAAQFRSAPTDDFTLELQADTFGFADLRVLSSAIPREGTGTLDLTAERQGAAFSVNFRRATAQVGASRVALSGTVAAGPTERAAGLTLELHNVRREDVQRAFDFELPGDGPYNGRITANGDTRNGVRVEGLVTGGAAQAPTRVALNGTIRGERDPVFDLQLTGNPFRLADTAFVVAIRARGPLDSLAIQGEMAMRSTARLPNTMADGLQPAPRERAQRATANLDLQLLDPPGAAPRRLSGRALLRAAGDNDADDATPVHALAEGTITFAKQPTVNARVTADSLPLALLPWPAAVQNVRGTAKADFRVRGVLENPTVNGELRVRSGAFYATRAQLEVTEINGPIRLHDDRVVVDSLSARLREGTVRVQGAALVLGQNKRVDLELHAESVQVTTSKPLYTASGKLRVTGPLEAARVTGRIEVLEAVTKRRGGTATGSAVLARGGALQVDVVADSLPVENLPLPADQIDQLEGHIRGRLAVRGTIDDPVINGRARLVDAGGRFRAAGTRLERVGGELRIVDGDVRTDGIHGRAGQGTVELSGTASLRAERALDLQLRADSAQLTDTDSARIIASAALHVTGVWTQPRITGRVQLVGGWAREDLLKANPVIDPEKPPYAELAARVPWTRQSRLLRAAESEKKPPAFQGQIVVEVTPGIKMVDEDSQLYGTGEVVLKADSAGIEQNGAVRFLGGFYTNFGQRFVVRGGGFRLLGAGESLLALRGEHDVNKLGGSDYGSSSPLDWYPGIEIFAIGTAATAVQHLRRLSPLPESQTQLAATLIYREPSEPIAGLYNLRFWLPAEGADFIGERMQQQGGALLWSYTADEAYDYLPLRRASLSAGSITIGSRFPGRIVQGPLFRFAMNVSPGFDLLASLAPAGSAAPGLRARWRSGSFSFVAFNEPKFFAAPPSGHALPGYFHRRRTGVGIRWDSDR